MGDDKIRVGDMNINGQRRNKQASQSALEEQHHKAQSVEHGSRERDGALVKRGRPVENLDGRGNGDQKAQNGEHHTDINRLPTDKHMVSPHQKADQGDTNNGVSHEAITKDALARETGNDFTGYPHGRQHHDVHRRMRIKPEKMLEEYGV